MYTLFLGLDDWINYAYNIYNIFAKPAFAARTCDLTFKGIFFQLTRWKYYNIKKKTKSCPKICKNSSYNNTYDGRLLNCIDVQLSPSKRASPSWASCLLCEGVEGVGEGDHPRHVSLVLLARDLPAVVVLHCRERAESPLPRSPPRVDPLAPVYCGRARLGGSEARRK